MKHLTSEDDTEIETTPEEIARKLCPELKKVQAEHEARKKKDENVMRFMSGFFVLSMWNLAYMLGTFYM